MMKKFDEMMIGFGRSPSFLIFCHRKMKKLPSYLVMLKPLRRKCSILKIALTMKILTAVQRIGLKILYEKRVSILRLYILKLSHNT